MNDGKRQVTDETEPDENPIATIHYENGTELTGKAVTLQDGTVGVRIPNEFFKTALLPDGSMPDGVLSVDIGPKHVEGGLPLTDDMVCMAVVLLQCLFDRFGSVFPQCGLMVFPGVVIVSR